MTTEQIWIAAGVAVLVIVVLVVILAVTRGRKRKERDRLRSRYGREYDATISDKGTREGVDDLAHREEERRSLTLRDPDETTRADLRERMALLQYRFVEDPGDVMLEAQRVVVDGLRARGYPVAEDRERALRLLSVDHPDQTPPLRTLLAGSYGQDIGRMREIFLEARRSLREVLHVSYSTRDLRGERSALATGEGREAALGQGDDAGRHRAPAADERAATGTGAPGDEAAGTTRPGPAGAARPDPEPVSEAPRVGDDAGLGHPQAPGDARRVDR